jgi:hypothetical protein
MLEKSFEIAAANNPDLAKVMSNETLKSMIEQGFKLYAMDFSPMVNGQDSPAFVMVMKYELGMNIPLDQLAAIEIKQLKKNMLANPALTSRKVVLGNTQAVEIIYAQSLPMMTGKKATTLNTLFLVTQNKSAYFLICSAPIEIADQYTKTFDDISKTLSVFGANPESLSTALPLD